MEVKLFSKPSILKYCIPFYKGNTAVMLIAEKSGLSTKFSLHGFDMEKRVRLGQEVHISHKDLQCLIIQNNNDYKDGVFGLTGDGNLHHFAIEF